MSIYSNVHRNLYLSRSMARSATWTKTSPIKPSFRFSCFLNTFLSTVIGSLFTLASAPRNFRVRDIGLPASQITPESIWREQDCCQLIFEVVTQRQPNASYNNLHRKPRNPTALAETVANKRRPKPSPQMGPNWDPIRTQTFIIGKSLHNFSF